MPDPCYLSGFESHLAPRPALLIADTYFRTDYYLYYCRYLTTRTVIRFALQARAGSLSNALRRLKQLPFPPSPFLWTPV